MNELVMADGSTLLDGTTLAESAALNESTHQIGIGIDIGAEALAEEPPAIW
jgi:hypothetical protein